MKKHEIISVFYKKQPTYISKGELLKKPYKHALSIIEKDTSHLSSKNNLNKDNSRKYKEYTHMSKHSVLYAVRACSKNEARLHPTQKPVVLFEYLIKTYTNEDDLVLDNCIGSGTTAIACIKTKRNFIGMELNENYFQIARERILSEILNKENN